MRVSRLPEPVNLGQLFERAADRQPDRMILTDRPPDIAPEAPCASSFAGWAERVSEAAGWLHAAGVRPWDRVALFKQNHGDVLVLACAAARLGAIPATLAWTHDRHTMEVLLRRLDSPVLVTDLDRIASAELDDDLLAALTARTVVVDGATSNGYVCALRHLRGAPPPPPAPRRIDEPMMIAHTSGTTGVPKLAIHSARTVQALARLETERWPWLGLRGEDRAAICNPYFHARYSTMLTAACTVGLELILLSDPQSQRVQDVLERHPPTILEAPPNAFLRWEPFARADGESLSRVRMFASTFDAIHARTVRTFLAASRRRVPVWAQGWGQSEAGPVTVAIHTRRSVRPSRRAPSTQNVGRPLPVLTRLRVVEPVSLKPVRRGRVGLVEVRQRGAFLGYVGEQERYERKRRGGWWNTGDLGIKSLTGAIRLVDREVDQIPGMSGISLEDLLLDRLPELTEAIVLPVTDGPPVPVVCTAGDMQLDEARWETAVADLPPLDEPVQLTWEAIPRTATWKVRRFMLREHIRPGAVPIGSGRWT